MRIRKKTYGFEDLLLIPRYSTIESRSNVNIDVALCGMTFTCPVISANMDTVTGHTMATAMHDAGGLGIIHRYLTLEQRLEELSLISNLPYRAMSMGVTQAELDIAIKLLEKGANVICVDIAHGHSRQMKKTLKALRNIVNNSKQDVRPTIIAGNVATPEGAYDLTEWGADIIKVGVGPGSVCTTRIVTGAGYGQLSAISDCYAATDRPIIADGGIRNSGDAVKALAAGATMVMLGRLLAGTDEVPSVAKQSRTFRGMASAEAQTEFYGYDFIDRQPEGVSMNVANKGPVKNVLRTFNAGIRSGLSYVGARSLVELQKSAEFVECAPGVNLESLPHGTINR